MTHVQICGGMQVAGHVDDEGRPTTFVDPQGCLHKQVQSGERGQRESALYALAEHARALQAQRSSQVPHGRLMSATALCAKPTHSRFALLSPSINVQFAAQGLDSACMRYATALCVLSFQGSRHELSQALCGGLQDSGHENGSQLPVAPDHCQALLRQSATPEQAAAALQPLLWCLPRCCALLLQPQNLLSYIRAQDTYMRILSYHCGACPDALRS